MRVMFRAVICLCLAAAGYGALADSTTGSWEEVFYERYDAEAFSAFAPAARTIDMTRIDYPPLNAAVFYETSRARQAHGRPPFTHAKALEKAAFAHSRAMVEGGFFSHTNPRDAARRTLSLRLALVGVTRGTRAENIAVEFGIRYAGGTPLYPPEEEGESFRDARTGQVVPNHTYLSFARAVVGGWMRSPGHRSNILEPVFRYLGCGAYHYEDGSFHGMHRFKVTQNFASDVD
jgi:uncharacterized protein YkwD